MFAYVIAAIFLLFGCTDAFTTPPSKSNGKLKDEILQMDDRELSMAMKPRKLIYNIFRTKESPDQKDDDDDKTTPNPFNPEIAVKPRATMSRDEKSGKFNQVNINQVVASTAQEDIISTSKWNKFKDSVYDTTDFIGLIPQKISRKNQEPNVDVETSYSKNSGLTPSERLLQQYELRNPKSTESFEQDLYKSDLRKTFDGIKDGMYDSLNIFGSKESDASQSLSSQMLQSSSFKVASKPSLNEELSQYTKLADDLTSDDTTRKFKANVSLMVNDYERKRRELDQQRRDIIDFIKDFIYNIFDSIQMVFQTLISIPQQIQNTVETFGTSIGEAVEVVKDIPSKTQQVVNDVKYNVEETQRITKEVVEDIQNIPKTVSEKIAETEKSILQTKENIKAFSNKVDDLAYDAKILVGIEKYKPTPPPPPQKKTGKEIATEIATDIAGTVVTEGTKFAGKAALFTVQKGVDLGVAGAKLAWSSATSPKPDDKTEPANTKVINTPRKSTKVVPKKEVSIKNGLDEIDPMLALEISSALKLAEDALASEETESVTTESVKQIENTRTDSVKEIDINEAVRKAKEAAAQAAADAAELESLINSRRKKM